MKIKAPILSQIRVPAGSPTAAGSAFPLVELPRGVDRPEKFPEGTIILHRDLHDFPDGFYLLGEAVYVV